MLGRQMEYSLEKENRHHGINNSKQNGRGQKEGKTTPSGKLPALLVLGLTPTTCTEALGEVTLAKSLLKRLKTIATFSVHSKL